MPVVLSPPKSELILALVKQSTETLWIGVDVS